MENFKIHTSLEFDANDYSKNKDKFTVCHSQKEAFPASYIRPLYCKGRPLARYVSIEKTSVGKITPLKFCELEVYGEPFDGRWLAVRVSGRIVFFSAAFSCLTNTQNLSLPSCPGGDFQSTKQQAE